MQVSEIKEKAKNSVKQYYSTHNGWSKGTSLSKEHRQKIGEANSKHQKGSGNSQYGTMWIHNSKLKKNKKISKAEEIPDGWIKGRKLK